MASDPPRIHKTQRLFLALWPDAGVRQQLLDHTRLWTWPTACVQYRPEDWHITLHFIGQVSTEQVADITAAAVVPFQPLELVLDQPRLWAHGLAVLCAGEVPAPLQVLYDRLGGALQANGLQVDTRPYQPHVTLARRADAAMAPTTSTPVVWWIDRYALVVSTGGNDPRYRVIHKFERNGVKDTRGHLLRYPPFG